MIRPGDRLENPVTGERFTFTEPHMGTLFKIIVFAPDEATANRAVKGAFERIARRRRRDARRSVEPILAQEPSSWTSTTPPEDLAFRKQVRTWLEDNLPRKEIRNSCARNAVGSASSSGVRIAILKSVCPPS